MSGIVTLVSQDQQKIEVELNVIRQSKVISGMLQDLGEDEDTEYPIPNVSHAILKKIIEWCEQHKDDAPVDDEDPSYQEKKRTAEVPRWDAEFLKVDQGTLFEIILAANYLDICRLLDFACMTVADQIRGKTPEEIRKHFNIKNDFTEEEMEQIKKENEWCEGN